MREDFWSRVSCGLILLLCNLLMIEVVEVESKESDHRDLSSQEKRSTLTIDGKLFVLKSL